MFAEGLIEVHKKWEKRAVAEVVVIPDKQCSIDCTASHRAGEGIGELYCAKYRILVSEGDDCFVK
jgi:hypothetical protein